MLNSEVFCEKRFATENFGGNMVAVAKSSPAASRRDQGLTVALERPIAEALEEWCDRYKCNKKAILAGIIGWWSLQPSVVKRAIAVGVVDPEFAGAYAAALRSLADRLDADPLKPAGLAAPSSSTSGRRPIRGGESSRPSGARGPTELRPETPKREVSRQ